MIDAIELVGTVFSGLSALVIEDVVDAGDVICVRARTRDRAVACSRSPRFISPVASSMSPPGSNVGRFSVAWSTNTAGQR
jgi:hypothetical protein